MKKILLRLKSKLTLWATCFALLFNLAVSAQTANDYALWLGDTETGIYSWLNVGNLSGTGIKFSDTSSVTGKDTGTYINPNGSWASNIVDDIFIGKRYPRIDFLVTYPGQTAAGWPALTTSEISDVWFQFSVTPAIGYDFNVNEISFEIAGSGTGNMMASAYISTDSTFETKTQIMGASHLGSYVFTSVDTSINLIVNDGQTLYLRVYPWYNNNATPISGKRELIRNVKFSGVTTAASDDYDYSLDVSVLNTGTLTAGEFAAMDGTWGHDNGNDAWDISAIGTGAPGGISLLSGYLRFQDPGNPTKYAMPDPSNRKILMIKDLASVGASTTVLDKGATLFFRTRLATDGVLDSIHPDPAGAKSIVPATGDGYEIHNGGVGMIGIKQGSGGLISFSLQTAEENGTAGLVMNSLNGTTLSAAVDKGEGTANVVALDPTVWHDFLITIKKDDSGAGTHEVNVSVDGAAAQKFIVTAGNASTYTGVSELRLGAGATSISGAFDISALKFASEKEKLPDGLVAYWKLDGDVKDAAGASDGSIINGDNSLYTEGHMGEAIDFRGATDSTYILVPHNDVIDFDSTQNFSVSLLVKGKDLQENWLFVKGSSGKNNPDHPTWDGKRYEMFFSGPNLRWVLDDDKTKSQAICNNASTSEYMDQNGWNHIVGVRDVAQDSLFIYINGKKVASAKDGTDLNIANSSPLIIGQMEILKKPPLAAIDEFRIMNKALSPAEVSELFDSYDLDIKLYPDGVVAWWKLDGDATDFLKTSDGTLMNGSDTQYVDGHTGKAINFKGISDSTHIFVPSNNVIDFDSTESFSVSLLINGDSIISGWAFVKGASSNVPTPANPTWNGKRYEMYFDGSGKVRFGVDDDKVKSQATSPVIAPLMHPNAWNHLVGVRDIAKDSIFLYLNGIQVAAVVDGANLNISNSSPLIIGNNEALALANLINAKIDELRIYNKALSSAEIAALSKEYGIAAISSDATLSNLKAGGTTVTGFAAATTTYTVELTSGTTIVPTVTATATNSKATVTITAATALPGSTTVLVTAENGTTKTYTINFTIINGIDNFAKNSLKLFPNPVSDVLNITCSERLTEIAVYNVTGSKILYKNINSETSVQINVSTLSKGTYIIKVKTNTNNIITNKFIK